MTKLPKPQGYKRNVLIETYAETFDDINTMDDRPIEPDLFPFRDLAIGMSFGIKNKTKYHIRHIIEKQNKRTSKRFTAFDCDPLTDPDGASVRVFRKK